MPKLWRIHQHDSARIAALERSAGVPAVLAQLLLCRGLVEPAAVRDFLDCKLSHLRDPDLLPGMAAACECIMQTIAAGGRIVVYGDYDVDGVTGASLLVQCLQALGANARYYIPHRIDEGYGLNDEALERLAADGTRLVITVDCGIASVAEAQTARRLGMQLVITDHHEPPAQLPEAAAIVHPKGPGEPYPFAGLSGAGVAFKLAWGLCKRASGSPRVGERLREFLLDAVGLAALGTVADCVPLVDENRVLVQYGLSSLKRRVSPGLAALFKLTGLDKKPQLESEDIGFALAPRLNAAGRLGQAQLAAELLTTSNPERATALAEYIHELNDSRQSLERSIYLAANKQVQSACDAERDSAFVLAERDWHPGVIGIVAGRLAEKYHRPVVMIALDPLGVKPGVGSARSVPGFPLHTALTACSEHLVTHGGHAAAAGLRIEEGRLSEFREAFLEFAAAHDGGAPRPAELWIDAEVSLAGLTMRVVELLQRMAPFGHANPRPLLCATGVTLAEAPRKIGGAGRHLSLKLAQHDVTLRGVAFGGGEWFDELAAAGPLDVAFRPIINNYRGRRTVELHVADWRVGSVAPEDLPRATPSARAPAAAAG